MLHHQLRNLTGVLIAGLFSLSAQAQIAQSPLLAKTVGQVPNIVFVFDDSGSMPATAIYQYGTSFGGQGMSGPGTSPDNNPPPAIYGQSPNVNLIYYDPRETYAKRINWDGTYMPAGSTTGITSFPVYFYKPPNTTLYSVSGVTIGNKGSQYPASGVTGTFTAAPAGGTTATATVTTAPSNTVSSVTVNSMGANYNATGVTATFSAPSAGGIQATGTVTIGTSGKVNTVTVNNGGSYTGSGVTATFSAPAAGGVQATGTPTMSNRATAASVTVNTRGTGFSATPPTITFQTPPAGGTQATGTVTTANYYRVNTVTRVSGGSGYSAGPLTVTFSAPPAGGVQATGTASTSGSAPTRSINAITITNPGSGYTSPPTIVSISGSAPTIPAVLTVNTTTSYGISGVSITNPGAGYTATPTYTLGGTVGTGYALTVNPGNSWVVSGFSLTNAGSGYSTPPTISLSGASGSGAAFTTSLTSTNVVTAINVTNPGAGYTTPPTITLTGVGSGTGATFTVNTGTTNVIQSINVTNAGSGYLVPPTFTLNPSTGSGATFTVSTNTTSVANINKDWDGVGTPTTAASYFTPSYLPDAANPLAPGADATVTYPNLAQSTIDMYPKFKGRSDCAAATHCTWAEEVQNYANWKAYHRTRLELAKTGIGLAFQPLTATFRLGWATISNDLDSNSRLAAGVRLYDDTARQAFFTWLYNRTGTNNTPNRTAINKVGQYYMRKDDDGPWGANPSVGSKSTNSSTGTANSAHAACRRNYALLMTDGYYNESFSTSDTDSTTGQTNAAGVTYVPKGPYSDTKAGTAFANGFSDVTFKYWFQSLRPDLSQTALKTKPTDEATWPHMNFYAIGLGIIGTLDATSADVYYSLGGMKPDGTYLTRTLDWPTPTANNPKAIDDMWHATINGRGLLLNAATASKLQKSILQIISDVGGLQDSQAGVAASATSLTSTTEKFTPLFTSQYWTGNVQAHLLDPTTADETTLAWEVESVVSTDPVTGISTYASKIPAASSRNIVVGNGATSGVRAVSFTKAAMDSASLTSLMGGTVTDDLVNYLRGDSSLEASDANASNPNAVFRVRQTRLGDVVNSTPVFVKGDLDGKYDNVPGAPGYRTFAGNKSSQRTEGVLFVGANDGMLHAFRDGATAAAGNSPSASSGGVEVFAYVPRAVLPAISALSDPFYGADAAHPHRYLVDGPSAESDVYLPTASRWANIVIGSTGAGAGTLASAGNSPRTGIFAIDATSLSTSVTSLNASSVMWEVGSYLSDFAELGYMTSKIETGPTLDGSWVAVFGNGYESASCKAQLFIVNVETGALIKKIDTGVGSCGASTKNGLGGVALVRNADKQIIGAYAGDLQGNVWKFDLNSSVVGDWKLDFGGDALYKTRTGQAITAAPSVIDLSTTPASTTPKPGYMVVFETGKFLESTDVSTTTVQTIYGVWDEQLFGASPLSVGGAKVRVVETQLVSRSISNVADGTNEIDFTTKKGWFYDFIHSGERMVFPMNVVVNRFVRGTSLTPVTTGTGDPCLTGTGGDGRPYTIDALSGKSIPEPLIIIPPEPPPPPFVDCTTDPTKCTIISITSNPKAPPPIVIPCELTNTCAVTTTVNKRRQWRQLFPR